MCLTHFRRQVRQPACVAYWQYELQAILSTNLERLETMDQLCIFTLDLLPLVYVQVFRVGAAQPQRLDQTQVCHVPFTLL